MPNANYEPDAVGDAVMRVLRNEQRATPGLIRAETEYDRREINNALTDLVAAGWVSKRHRGLYDYEADPRVDDGDDRAQRAETPRETDAVSHARETLADWDPADVDSAKARRATVAAVGWLDAQADRERKTAIVAALGERDATEGYSESTLWEKVVQPGLRELVDAGVVTHTRGSGYAIAEEGP